MAAEIERDLISQRTKAGLDAARVRGRNGGAPYKMTAANTLSSRFT
jgi:DNA invertase Pin-like site-specific DNA recombinase